MDKYLSIGLFSLLSIGCQIYTDGFPLPTNPLPPLTANDICTSCCPVDGGLMESGINQINVTDFAVIMSDANGCNGTINNKSINIPPIKKWKLAMNLNDFDQCSSDFFINSPVFIANAARITSIKLDLTYKSKYFTSWNGSGLSAYLDELTIGFQIKDNSKSPALGSIGGYNTAALSGPERHLIVDYDIPPANRSAITGFYVNITSILRQVNHSAVPDSFFDNAMGITTININSVQIFLN